MLIKVKESPLFGKLVDDLLKKGVSKINSLEWKPLEVRFLLLRKLMENKSQYQKESVPHMKCVLR
jgi:hypothetical protein